MKWKVQITSWSASLSAVILYLAILSSAMSPGVGGYRYIAPTAPMYKTWTWIRAEIEVKWNAAESDSYPVEIEIEAIDKPNLLTSIMNTLSERKANVEAVTARSRKFESAMIQLVVEIHDVDHLNNVMGALRQVSGVLNVYRANPT